MTTERKSVRNKELVRKIARSVNFSSESLSGRRKVCEDRKQHIKIISTKALSSINI